jgi:rhamnosyltransferase
VHEPARVAVLLATHNGRAWLPEQLDSVLAQQDVQVRVVVSDDASGDGTQEWLAGRAAQDPRVVLLPANSQAGGAAANFYRLLEDVRPGEADLFALCDQDDVWLPGKLSRHVSLLRERGVDGVSSNVTAFTAAGARAVIRKDFPQRRYDYLFESPGPGSTFLLTPRLVALVQQVLADPSSTARGMDFHDWLIYGLCRGRRWGWLIDSAATVEYRQHATNAFGANSGARSALRRLALVRGRWHRAQAVAMARVALSVAPDQGRADLARMLELLQDEGPRSRAALVARAAHLRRRPRDRAILAALVGAGLW